MGWASTRNGDLLRLAVATGFDAFLTADRKLEHQQNLSALNVAVPVPVADSNTVADLQPLMPRVLDVLPRAKRGEATVVSSRDDSGIANG
jgi:hypothetical protein